MEDRAGARARAHEARVDALLAPHLARQAAGEKHPVHDFLLTYYSFRPSQLRRWHPGTPTASEIAAKHGLVESIHRLLVATAARPANLGCFGLHEWAMVHRLAPEQVRHRSHRLRLGATATDEVVETHRIACSHFDAFRFFTPTARPLNLLSPGPADRPEFEQPGCLHGGMDLYKHAFRLSPLICSDLVMDAFELAWEIRILDMRAAPYDFTGLRLEPTGEEWTPVRIETPEGKQEYAAAQRGFAERGAPIRARLIAECERLLGVAACSSPDGSEQVPEGALLQTEDISPAHP